MTGLFDCSSDNISLHLKKSVDRGLNEDSVAEKISATAAIGTYKSLRRIRPKKYHVDENVQYDRCRRARRQRHFKHFLRAEKQCWSDPQITESFEPERVPIS